MQRRRIGGGGARRSDGGRDEADRRAHGGAV
jgi:hypothetical protein